MTYLDTLKLTIPGRDIKPIITREQEIERLERWIAESSQFAWTAGYKANVARLAELKAGA